VQCSNLARIGKGEQTHAKVAFPDIGTSLLSCEKHSLLTNEIYFQSDFEPRGPVKHHSLHKVLLLQIGLLRQTDRRVQVKS